MNNKPSPKVETKPVAIFSLELLNNGKFRINTEWGPISNNELNLFINSVVAPSDWMMTAIQKKINDAAKVRGQEKLVDAFLSKSKNKSTKKKEPLYRPSQMVRHHFLQSQSQIGGDDE